MSRVYSRRARARRFVPNGYLKAGIQMSETLGAPLVGPDPNPIGCRVVFFAANASTGQDLRFSDSRSPCELNRGVGALARMRPRAAAGAAVILVAAGCSGHRPVAIDQTRRPVVTRAAWQAVINDWFHGGIDHGHSCSAVRVAITHLSEEGDVLHPERDVRGDLEAYERSVC